jgi:hypothetical protein
MEMDLSENLRGESPLTLLHLVPSAGARTFCGRKFLKLSKGVNVISADSFFGGNPPMLVLRKETLCEKCEDTEEYAERYGLWLLARMDDK